MEELRELLAVLKQFLEMVSGSSSKTESVSTKPTSTINLTFQNPIRGAVRSSGNYDPTGKGSVGRIHQGVDLRASLGTSIYPIAPGKVSKVYNDPKGGNSIVIVHPNGYSSYYAHCGTINVYSGDNVNQNTVIATVGDTGNAKGKPAHLHLQVWRNGSLIDPAGIISVPTYTPFDPRKERAYLSEEAKEKAANFNLAAHLAQRDNKRMV